MRRPCHMFQQGVALVAPLLFLALVATAQANTEDLSLSQRFDNTLNPSVSETVEEENKKKTLSEQFQRRQGGAKPSAVTPVPSVNKASQVSARPLVANVQSLGEPANQSLDYLFDRVSDNPQNLDNNFRYATMAVQQEKYEEAIAAYERMLMINPNLHRVKLDLAMALYKTNRLKEAEKLFEEVLATNPPAVVAQNIHMVLAEMTGSRKRHFVNMGLNIGFNHSSNANAIPSSGAVDIFGTSQTLSGTNAEADLQGFAQAVFNHRYAMPCEGNHTWNTQISAYAARQQDLSNLNVTAINAETGPVFDVPTLNAKLGLKAKASQVILDGNDYLSSTGVEAYLSKMFSNRVRGRVAYSYEDKDFKNTEEVTTYSDKNSQAHQVVTSVSAVVTPNDIVNAQFSYGREYARQLYNSNTFYGLGLTYTRLMEDGYFVNVNSGWKNTAYDTPDILVNPSLSREDEELTYGVSVGKRLARNITCSLGYSYREVDSNIQNYTYDNHRVTGNLSVNY